MNSPFFSRRLPWNPARINSFKGRIAQCDPAFSLFGSLLKFQFLRQELAQYRDLCEEILGDFEKSPAGFSSGAFVNDLELLPLLHFEVDRAAGFVTFHAGM